LTRQASWMDSTDMTLDQLTVAGMQLVPGLSARLGRGARRRGRVRTDATIPLREAHAVAARIGARPLLRGHELLVERAP
jgi:hypothetical protein